MSNEIEIKPSSGNVFADLGIPEADHLLAKADLAIELTRIISARGLTQVEAAQVMGVDQPKVSALINGRLDGFSMERLYRFLNAFDRDVEIVVKPKPKSRKAATLKVTRRPGRLEERRTSEIT